jgi:hypothetical protein
MAELRRWSEYLTAQETPSAALTGLIFVVRSFNFGHIVADKAWLSRAGAGLVLLAQPTMFGLIGRGCCWSRCGAAPAEPRAGPA